jgi:hypothetical protein
MIHGEETFSNSAQMDGLQGGEKGYGFESIHPDRIFNCSGCFAGNFPYILLLTVHGVGVNV